MRSVPVVLAALVVLGAAAPPLVAQTKAPTTKPLKL